MEQNYGLCLSRVLKLFTESQGGVFRLQVIVSRGKSRLGEGIRLVWLQQCYLMNVVADGMGDASGISEDGIAGEIEFQGVRLREILSEEIEAIAIVRLESCRRQENGADGDRLAIPVPEAERGDISETRDRIVDKLCAHRRIGLPAIQDHRFIFKLPFAGAEEAQCYVFRIFFRWRVDEIEGAVPVKHEPRFLIALLPVRTRDIVPGQLTCRQGGYQKDRAEKGGSHGG